MDLHNDCRDRIHWRYNLHLHDNRIDTCYKGKYVPGSNRCLRGKSLSQNMQNITYVFKIGKKGR